MNSNNSVISFAEARRDDPANEEYETRYWAAYLDGARAQAKEDMKAMSRMIKRNSKSVDNDESQEER